MDKTVRRSGSLCSKISTVRLWDLLKVDNGSLGSEPSNFVTRSWLEGKTTDIHGKVEVGR